MNIYCTEKEKVREQCKDYKPNILYYKNWKFAVHVQIFISEFETHGFN